MAKQAFTWGLPTLDEPQPGHNKVSRAGDSPTLSPPTDMRESDLTYLGPFKNESSVIWECWYVKSLRRFDFHSKDKRFGLLEGTLFDRVATGSQRTPSVEYRAWVEAVKLGLVKPTGKEPQDRIEEPSR